MYWEAGEKLLITTDLWWNKKEMTEFAKLKLNFDMLQYMVVYWTSELFNSASSLYFVLQNKRKKKTLAMYQIVIPVWLKIIIRRLFPSGC